ncbi:hypothetical protein [Eleftheria terrae]|uniref:hypothetical protein n=1 Tax=Eleftheria terrae TaxID=1597781 RepID=UPI00263BCF17|nr:hypothetical protein [Eleftheria terrae]WKB52984.1 hypothetical protein N7L95_00855 [Eleftheria terrae]
MAQFSLESMTAVHVKNVNVRSEMHGDEHVPAADIAFKWVAPNTVLSEFHGALLDMFYTAPEPRQPDTQTTLECVAPISHKPLLRCSLIDQPLKLSNEYVGYALTVDRGLGGDSNIELDGCSVNQFRLHLLEGGTVEVHFRAQASKLSGPTIGDLATLIGDEVRITLTPPKAAPELIDGSRDSDWYRGGDDDEDDGEEMEPAPKDATDIFAETHGS